jgi:ATP-dependent 26S proteasome regulatory subunit
MRLCPAQQQAHDALMADLSVGNVFTLGGGTGAGKTTVLREVHHATGGAFLGMKELVDALRAAHPLAVEETFEKLIMDALRTNEVVLVDDLHLLLGVVNGCGAYPRSGLLDAPLLAVATHAVETGKKLLFGGGHPDAVRQRGYTFGIAAFEVPDYEFLTHAYLGDTAARLDHAKIYRFAPNLNAHHFKAACRWLRREEHLDTERFIDYLRSQYLASNVDLSEVQPVALTDLKGVDEVIRALETHIIVPLENDALAAELQLKPKRGVLLVGPPGTGKTTVGRALAHRLKSKFFLVDGTVISGTSHFYGAIHHIFESAKQNAPSILFIDDSDVIFESGEELGLYRYLLTMLDGLESASAGRVCVMLTAMEVSNLPPALLRSGRIELWLEMHLPDDDARLSILQAHLNGLPEALGGVETPQLVTATKGFTGADLKRVVEDGKNLYAFDRASGARLKPLTEYFLAAVDTVRQNKQRYAEAEAQARRQRPARPPYFDVAGMHG